jgi:hypothetical protein
MTGNASPVEPRPTNLPQRLERIRVVLGRVCLALGLAATVCTATIFIAVNCFVPLEPEFLTPVGWAVAALSGVGLVVGLVYYVSPRFDDDPRQPCAGRVLLCLLGLVGFPQLVFLSAYVRSTQERYQATHKLESLGKAMHNYAAEHEGKFPRIANGRPGEPGGLSWRVALLPYLGEESLFKEFHLDEPWNSPHNLQLLKRMPEVYKPIRNYHEPYTTYYQVVAGSAGLFRDNRAPHLRDFSPNGSYQTILIVEAAEAVPWTKPADLVFDRDGPLPKVGGASRRTCYFAMGDGAVRGIELAECPEDALRSALSPDGDKFVPLP